jgi:hypothetical protein
MSARPNKLLAVVAAVTWLVVAALVLSEAGLLALTIYNLYLSIDVASILIAVVTTALIFFSRHIIHQARIVTRHFLS